MKTIVSLVFVVLVLLAQQQISAQTTDMCGGAPTCPKCVAIPECGWCSTPTISIRTNLPGPQCAGVAKQDHEFRCPGEFSIEKCSIGWNCDQATFQCVPAGAGKGQPLATCQQQCINNGTVYTCDKKTEKCIPAPAGTPGAGSLEVCEQSCSPTQTPNTNTGSPASNSPSQSSTTATPGLFACNYTSGVCEPAQPGKGASLQVCQQSCSKQTNTAYTCNPATKQCDPLPPGVPGPTLAQCQNMCNPTAAPNPPPGFPTGLYKGLLIDNDYSVAGVIYVDVEETSFTMVTLKDGQVASYLEGTPTHIPPSQNNENNDIMVIDITAPASAAGKTFATISDLTGLNGPETTFITMAYTTQLGGAAPSGVTAAMTSNGAQHVIALAKCLTPECKFYLPKLPSGMIYFKKYLHLFPHEVLVQASNQLRSKSGYDDQCTAYGASCELCLSHPGCGFCSQANVVYINGQTGTQCAGFNANINTTTPWECPSNFETGGCPTGQYQCDKLTGQCIKAAAGNGTSLQTCLTQCTVTQTQAPPVKQYVCNITLKQCFPCNTTACPGSSGLQECEAECAHHKKGPPAHLVGTWFGFQIQAGADNIKYTYHFDNTSVTAWKSSTQIFTADIISFGNDAMIFTFTSGKGVGFKRGVYYQESAQVPNNLYEAITFAEGTTTGKIPQSFPPAMTTPGEAVYIFYKCNNAPCKFSQP